MNTATATKKAPWDTFERPDKTIEDYSRQEILTECQHLAQVYLLRRGYDCAGELWESPKSGMTYLVATDGRERVLVQVKGEGPEGVWPPALKVLGVAKEDLALYSQIDPEDGITYRLDIIAIMIQQQRMARLRHLVNGAEWN